MNITAKHSLDMGSLFAPRSVAIVGASANLNSIGGQPISILLKHGFSGRIYPVNPKYKEIAGFSCFPDIASLPEVPDVLVIAVAAGMVPEIIRDAGRKGILFAIIFSSGFAEIGKSGLQVQEGLCSLAREFGMTLIGPNCQGIMNISDTIHIGFGPPYALRYRPGDVSMTSQSGAFGNSLLMGMDAEGVGFRHYISTGNEAETTSLDCFEYFLDDPKTKVISGYVEGFKDARRMRAIGRKALQQNKPLVLWKVGNTEAGANAAASHTANLAGNSAYYQTAFRQFGIIGVNDVGDMADCVRAFATGRRAQGRGVAVMSISGGAGIALADRSIELGLELTEFSSETLAQLRALLPAFASFANPLDVTASVLNSPENFGAVLQVIADNPKIDMLAIGLAALSGDVGIMAAREIAALASKRDIPILVAWNAVPDTAQKAYPILEEAGVPVYCTPVRCARGLGALWEFAQAVKKSTIEQPHSTVVSKPQSGTVTSASAGGALNEFDSKQLLSRYGIPITKEKVANSTEEAIDIAYTIGFPVVMKILSADIPHKSDSGGVRIGLKDEESIRTAYKELVDLPKKLGVEQPADGVLVQEMVPGGVEVILGTVNDSNFGPLIMFGAGGIYAEVFKDIAFRLAPLTHQNAEELLAETKIAKVLSGVRGKQEADKGALIDCILQLSQLAVDLESSVGEIDINPLIVLPKGQGVRVVDALVRLK
ncbi:acetate--CoA ligase family protein [Desulforhopalus singaporensis]|uniref:Acyl-CoA synthetase (NDP forming) n=1 Tax=Desulforhopalus singaporensis TaxID=91360 RepID=A0A1H0V2Q3_9BACT|nr:acetate--CoA ligase family protein [Desulforhopalus singaporensis]SDP72346.1 Acyl-CoA synthetase (NDP forming) [Desulforhopalus singaporensis]